MLNYSVSDLKEILEKGATMLEHNINDTTHQMKHPISPDVIAEAIKKVGRYRNNEYRWRPGD